MATNDSVYADFSEYGIERIEGWPRRRPKYDAMPHNMFISHRRNDSRMHNASGSRYIRDIMKSQREWSVLVRVVSAQREVMFNCWPEDMYATLINRVTRGAVTYRHQHNVVDLSIVYIGVCVGRPHVIIEYPKTWTGIPSVVPISHMGSVPPALPVTATPPTSVVFGATCNTATTWRESLSVSTIFNDENRGRIIRVVTGINDSAYVIEHDARVERLLSVLFPGAVLPNIGEPDGDCTVTLWLDRGVNVRVYHN